MNQLDRIVTHPGGAHKDDVLAVSLLAARSGAPIVRRDPTAEELDDPRVAVVDVGGSHDPERSNFDHHQFPREHPPTCALSLVLKAADLYDDARLFCDWLETAEYFDSRGPKRTAEWLGVPREAIGRLSSPIDVTLIRRFASQSEHSPGETIYDYLRLVGEDLLTYLAQVRAAIATVDEQGERWSVVAEGETIETVFLPRTSSAPDEPSASVARWIRARGLDAEIGAIAYPDRRGTGYGLSRHEDDPRLDFSRVADESDVHFAHANGFVCKTTATDPARLKELIRRAVVS